MCDVCGKDEDVGFASSAFGATSWAFCRECLAKPAEPLSMFEYCYEMNGENVNDWVKKFYTFVNGEYMSWGEFVKTKTLVRK